MMMRNSLRNMRFSALSLLLLLASAAPTFAQPGSRSDSLPRELVTALLGGSIGGSAIDVRVGVGDSALPVALFRDAQLLGFGDFRGSVMTVAYFPYAPQPTIDTIRARLLTAGWTAAPDPQTTERGFVSGYGGNPQALCSQESVVVPTVRIRSLHQTLVVISRQVSRGAVVSMCGGAGSPFSARGMRSGAENTPLPALHPPAGMQSRGGGSSGVADGGRSMDMSSSLFGALPLTDILANYARQFTAASWRKTEELVSTSIALAVFEITTATGERWRCAFSVSTPEEGVADVRLSLRKR